MSRINPQPENPPSTVPMDGSGSMLFLSSATAEGGSINNSALDFPSASGISGTYPSLQSPIYPNHSTSGITTTSSMSVHNNSNTNDIMHVITNTNVPTHQSNTSSSVNNIDSTNEVSSEYGTNYRDKEYYPRNKRAPYLYDISDFGFVRTSPRHTFNPVDDASGWDSEDNAVDGSGSGGASGGLKNSGASTMALSTKLQSSSSSPQIKPVRRRSSFATMFTALGMSPGATGVAEGMGSIPGEEGGGGGTHGSLDENEVSSSLPTRFRRGSGVGTGPSLRRGSGTSVAEGAAILRERIGSAGGSNVMVKYPRWIIQNDPLAIVMKDGEPVTLGTLIHHHSLLSPSQTSHPSTPYFVTPTWRLKERMKTVGVCLILALNIGTDPPDLNKPNPCAKLQCWLDPTSISRAKAKERIGERLEQQYARWQPQYGRSQQRPKVKYRRALDPTVDIVKELCFRMRESAKNERVLLHYNGHGVPRPTVNGEIWLFDKHHTNYIPFSVTDLRRWVGKPSIIVLDCSGAGVLMPFFQMTLNEVNVGNGSGDVGNGWNIGAESMHPGGLPHSRADISPTTTSDYDENTRAIRDTIVLCPTAHGEWLPMNPEFPADIFTSCLTTPIPIALRWFVYQNPLSMEFIDLETIYDSIPGKIQDRKSPLGELNWIFTAITDTIAWNVLPSSLFQRLFRQDLLVASIFRNFLLADRILRNLGCSPTSYPELPSTCNHPLWQSWDLAVETCLNQLIDDGYLRKKGLVPGVVAATSAAAASLRPSEDGEESETVTSNGPSSQSAAPISAGMNPSPLGVNVTFNVNAPFFAEQLTAFEIWLEFAGSRPRGQLVIRSPPSDVGLTPLPFLQANLGSREATRASHEIDPPEQLPIVLQVLLSQAHRVRALVLLQRFIGLGPSAVNLALSVGIFPYVLKLLQSPTDEYKRVLIGIWATVIGFDSSVQVDVVKDGALPHFIRHLCWGLGYSSPGGNGTRSIPSVSAAESFSDASEQRTMAAFILSVICSGYNLGQSECVNEKLHLTCGSLLQSLESSDESARRLADKSLTGQFRMWLCICLGNIAKDNAWAQLELLQTGLHLRLFSRLEDGSSDVRAASCYALAYMMGSAPTKSELDLPSLPSVVSNQESKPQPSLAPFQQGLGPMKSSLSVPPVMNIGLNSSSINHGQLSGGSMLMPTYDSSLQQHQYGLQQSEFQPQISPSLAALPNTAQVTGALSPGVDNPTIFGMIGRQESRTSLWDDNRMRFDTTIGSKLAYVTKDASPLVRFEAALALNRFVAKYFAAFVAIAGRNFGGATMGRNVLGGNIPTIPLPNGVSSETEKEFSRIWEAVFRLHRSDPYPSVRLLANSIVVGVNEVAMAEKNRLHQTRLSRRRTVCDGSIDETYNESDDQSPPTLAGRRNATGSNLTSLGTPPASLKRTGSIGTGHSAYNIGTPPSALQDSNILASLNKGRQNNMANGASISIDAPDDFRLESKFYDWKKVEFCNTDVTRDDDSDPLSGSGAMKNYRRTRNQLMQQNGQLLKDSFASLAQIIPPTRASGSPFNYDSWDRNEGDAAAGADKEIDLKKRAIHLRQVSLLRNSGDRKTSLLRFHPYEPALVVCGDYDTVNVWNAETSSHMSSFSNENPKNTRMTSACWVNEASTSLLLTGSNDGSVRIWDGIFEVNDELSRSKPSLVSSFFAAPDIVSDQRYSSGLVLEFQQCGGQLIAGGNTKTIRCWDVATEQCRNTFDSKTGASLTTLTTAWNHDFIGGYAGISPDIVVAGYGNGSLRVFDTRSRNGGPESSLNNSRTSASRRRWRYSEYDEHTSWIVDLSFTNYGGRYEVISGCVAGNIKFWDLRYSTSVRSLDHKMQMTALAVHSNVPMFATGSPAQFIKVMSHDGATQQVIRYHEQISGQRIGPVSCLSFHPHMPFLAAGFADDVVSLYAPANTEV
mmetsp:Transcript_1160/g.2189  ORF Transcript_1160/g.2189 Transcript_1160/m.2189 type:complete len:1924 (+) Transcript_1160:412-6183(+)